MINRTYVVNLPSAQRAQGQIVDICVQATMGTRALPVADPATYGAGNVTAPPAGWVAACGGTAYYEVRGRTLRFEHLFGAGAAGGFVSRTNLGFHLSVQPYGSWGAGNSFEHLAGVQMSQSLIAAVGGDVGGAIPPPNPNCPDPVYGVAQPVIRIYVPFTEQGAAMAVGILLVNFSIFERKDDDFSNIGSP
jgi:hypothetical protein